MRAMSGGEASNPEGNVGLSANRVEALADGIFAVAMTILVLAVTFIPFAVALNGAFGPRKFPCLLYGADLIIAQTSLCALWRYAAGGQRRLARVDLSQAEYSALLGRVVLGLCGYGLGMALALVWPTASLCCYAAIALLYLIPGRIDRQVRKPA
jgi:uncharacterized membrane protein